MEAKTSICLASYSFFRVEVDGEEYTIKEYWEYQKKYLCYKPAFSFTGLPARRGRLFAEDQLKPITIRK